MKQKLFIPVPKKKKEQFIQEQLYIEEEYLQKIILVAKKVAEKMISEKTGTGVNFYMANGAVAEQVVLHFHLHVIPRNQGDDIDFTGRGFKEISRPTEQEFETIRQKLNLVK
jgi:diadenosine tetraphosphate (Ap4A) HIT family hydrolase